MLEFFDTDPGSAILPATRKTSLTHRQMARKEKKNA
jgi:hypothetical protein